MKNSIINQVLQFGEVTFEIGKYKTIKNTSSINAALETGLVKIESKKMNKSHTGYEWVTLVKA
jgi:hypothetical protein